jgi:diguanylate cyclase
MNFSSLKRLTAQGNAEPFTLRHTTSELNDLYRKDRENFDIAKARQGLWLAVAAYLLFSVTDIILIPDVAVYTIIARSAIGIFSLSLFELMLSHRKSRDFADCICAMAVVLGYGVWLVFAVRTSYLNIFSYYMVFGSIFMMGANLFFSFRFAISIISSILILLFFLFSMISIDHGFYYNVCFGTFYIACFVFTTYINRNLNHERYNVFLNALEARIQQEEVADRGRALLRLSRTDPLTNLYNRRAIDDVLQTYWNDWKEFNRPFAVCLIDIDYFKRYNDYYGHISGDNCLHSAAAIWKETVRGFGGVIGRYGGEEFIALIHFERQEDIAVFAQGMRMALEDLALPHRGRRDQRAIVTASVGVSFTRPEADEKLEKLISEADRALYLAKEQGRNRVKILDQTDLEEENLREKAAEILKGAIDLDLISLVYQPIRNLKTEAMDTVEALMRLRMADGSEIPPTFFIPIAEKTGSAPDLQYWAIRTACREVLSRPDGPSVSLNISPMEMKAPDFAAKVAGILASHAVSADRLIFEITERMDLEHEPEILACLHQLRAMGIRIWLDDFGTGFAGLTSLRLVDFDTVKIDQSFLHDCTTPRGKAMLGDIAELIRNRGAAVLVEGVETREQLSYLLKLDVDHAQGFYIGIPLPANRLPRRTEAGPLVTASPKPQHV